MILDFAAVTKNSYLGWTRGNFSYFRLPVVKIRIPCYRKQKDFWIYKVQKIEKYCRNSKVKILVRAFSMYYSNTCLDQRRYNALRP